MIDQLTITIFNWFIMIGTYGIIGYVIAGCDCDGFNKWLLRLIFWPIYLTYVICGLIYEGIVTNSTIRKMKK